MPQQLDTAPRPQKPRRAVQGATREGPSVAAWGSVGPVPLQLPVGANVATELPADADGLLAIVGPDGLLVSFGRRTQGAEDGWQLRLEPQSETARAVLTRGSGGSADCESYQDGCSERFDAWSDNSRPSPVPWRRWLSEWIEAIGKR